MVVLLAKLRRQPPSSLSSCIAPLPDADRRPELPRFPGPPRGRLGGPAYLPIAQAVIPGALAEGGLVCAWVPVARSGLRARGRAHLQAWDWLGPGSAGGPPASSARAEGGRGRGRWLEVGASGSPEPMTAVPPEKPGRAGDEVVACSMSARFLSSHAMPQSPPGRPWFCSYAMIAPDRRLIEPATTCLGAVTAPNRAACTRLASNV
jgi:hypothetical protein